MATYKLMAYKILLTTILVLVSIISYANHSNADSLSYYNNLAYRYYSNDSSDNAIIAIHKALYYSDTTNNKKRMGHLYGLKGYILLSQGAAARALRSFAKTKNIGIEINNNSLIVAGYHGLGKTYIAIKEYDKAKKDLELGLKYASENNFIGAEAIFYNALGILEDSRGNTAKAISNFEEFLRISKERDDTLSEIYAYVNLGEIYLIIDLLDSAHHYIQLADNLNKYVQNNQAKASIFGNYGGLAYKKQNYEKSIALINKSLKISFDNNFSEFITDNYYSLIENYKALHNIDKAMEIYDSLDHYKDSIHNINDARKYAAIHSQNSIDEKEAQAKLWEQRFKNRNIILILSIALTVVFIVLLIILYKVYNSNRIQFRNDRKNFSDTIDEKNRELVTRIITESQHSSFMESINQSINEISKHKSIDEVKNSLHSLKSNIAVKEQINNNWDSFKIQFKQVHPNFFNSLVQKQANLTQNELRMCAYIKMNMSTKEIANILNISDRSIQTNRYRLKKKLNLSPQTDLITYIQAI